MPEPFPKLSERGHLNHAVIHNFVRLYNAVQSEVYGSEVPLMFFALFGAAGGYLCPPKIRTTSAKSTAQEGFGEAVTFTVNGPMPSGAERPFLPQIDLLFRWVLPPSQQWHNTTECARLFVRLSFGPKPTQATMKLRLTTNIDCAREYLTMKQDNPTEESGKERTILCAR